MNLPRHNLNPTTSPPVEIRTNKPEKCLYKFPQNLFGKMRSESVNILTQGF